MLFSFSKKTSLSQRSYQSKGPEHRQAFHIGQAELHQAQANDDAVKDVPTLLEVVVGIQGNDLEAHLCSEDPCEHLMTKRAHFYF